MKSISQKVRIAIVGLMLALPLFGVTQAAAQDQEFTPELYTSELSGFDVEVSGPAYEITGATMEHYQNGDGEIVNIEGEVATLEVSFFDDEDQPDDSIDAYLSGMDQSGIEYEELDRGVDGDVTYSIVLINYEGTDILYYMQVTEDITGNVDLFETILTGADFFEDDIQTAQEEIAIDGTPFMEEVDTDAILDVVDAGGSGTNDDDATPDATTEPATPQNSVTFELAGVDMDVAGDFEIDEEKIGDETIEGYTLSDDELFAAVAIGETGFSAEDTVASFSEGLTSSYDRSTEVESFEDGDSAWTLHEIEYNDQTRYLFVYADTTTVDGYETLISLEMDGDNVADSIENVQDNISIDGQPLLANVDADEVAGLVDDGAGDDADVTPEGTQDAGDDASDDDNPRDDAKLPGQNGDNTSETNNSDDTTPEATEEPAG